jgi:type II secretory pathway component GspD/PulD (secretin)
MTQKELVPTVESIIEAMDIKLSQVLIETAIIEVTLGDDLSTGIDWVQRGANDSMVNRGNYMLGGGGGTSAHTLEKMMSITTNLMKDAAWGGANPIGTGASYLLKSDKLNIAAVINASKSDSRAKYVASPIVMTVDNKEATIEAIESRKFFNGYETSSGYNYVKTPKYDDKEIGIKIKVKPKINPNGTVMLNVEEEYSQLGAGQQIYVDNGVKDSIDTALMRKMSADILLDNMQTVVLGGLTENYNSEKENGIPVLKDIPWIGKWLFGSVSQKESRKELLVFMTPYVLDDAEAAKIEAMRRKRSMSDPTPWEDGGWSASDLADPVSKKELMRRLKDEWKKQDEERKTKLAIEQAKVERVKKLEELSKEEREVWLKMHKEELEKEARKELEEKMLDEKSQEELRKIAASVREEKLKKAEKEIEESKDVLKEKSPAEKVKSSENAGKTNENLLQEL